jgi:hypothetical protein
MIKTARFDRRDLVDWTAAIRRTEFLDDRVKTHPACLSSVVMSRNRTPWLGKSGTVRISALMSMSGVMCDL